MKRLNFFIIFKELSMKQITQIFLEGESLTLKYIYIFFNSAHSFTNQLFSTKMWYEESPR